MYAWESSVHVTSSMLLGVVIPIINTEAVSKWPILCYVETPSWVDPT